MSLQSNATAFSSPAPLLLPLIPFLLLSGVMAAVAFLLAREKGRNVALWTFLGAVPFLNLICLSFFIGAANLRQERKIDQLLQGR